MTANAIPILVEQHDPADLAALDEAWSAGATFAFVPEKSGVPAAWLDSALSSIPEDLRTGHFALLTSGSTGRPKLVIGAKARSEALARLLHDVQESEPVAEAILALPLTYCYSFVNQWLWARVMSRRVVQTHGFSQPDTLRDALRRSQSAMICLVGIQVPLIAGYFAAERFEGVIRVHFAGGRFPQNELDVVRRCFPNAAIFNNYGCAEAMPRLTVRHAEEADIGSDVGCPLPGVAMRAGEAGELLFRSPLGAVALIDDEGLHRIAPEDWTATGDLGRIEAGRVILTGRASEVFKRHGEKIALPILLESVGHSWRGGAAFYRERDSRGEEGHVLVLAPHPGDEATRAILQTFRERHPRALWPLRIESVEQLPSLPNGKVDVGALPSLGNKIVHWRQRI